MTDEANADEGEAKRQDVLPGQGEGEGEEPVMSRMYPRQAISTPDIPLDLNLQLAAQSLHCCILQKGVLVVVFDEHLLDMWAMDAIGAQ